jgi:Cellulase (glycosyl hydrolase family 5)
LRLRHLGGPHGLGYIAAALAVAAFGLLALAAPASAIETVIQDDAQLLHRSDDEVRASMEQIRSLGINRVRITAGWSTIAPDADAARRPDFLDTDPLAYPQSNWANLDRAVKQAHQAGLQVIVDIAFWAPRWATHDPAGAQGRLRTDIDPVLYAHFAEAVARRYSGHFTPVVPRLPAPPAPPKSADATLLDQLLGKPPPPPPTPQISRAESPPPPLPAVSLYTLWNEPNHPGFLGPQWAATPDGWVPRSAAIYRAMVLAAYPAIKAVSPDARVLIGGTTSMGSSVPGQSGVPPLRFLRALACVDERLQPVSTGDCASFQPLPGDGWAHHPYSLKTPPNRLPHNPDNVPIAAIPRLTATLRALAAAGRISQADADVYLTEYGYETNPPDTHAILGLGQQATYLAWAEWLATQDPAVKMWPQFLLRDLPGDTTQRDEGAGLPPILDNWQSGLFFANGTPKPAAQTFASPGVAICQRRGRKLWVRIWSRLRRPAQSPGSNSAEIESSGPGAPDWKAVPSTARPRARFARYSRTVAPTSGAEAVRWVRWRRGTTYRVHWTQGSGASLSPASPALGC